MASFLDTIAKINNRRSAGLATDVNADFVGRRPSGDPRLDLAAAERRFS